MTSVKVRVGEPLDKALRALKKKLDREGVMKAAKAHRFYDKPSVKSRAKAKAALKYKKPRSGGSRSSSSTYSSNSY
jgi:small subunit ribosomal protein S21